MLHTFADAPRPMDGGFYDAHRLPMIFAPDGSEYFMFQGGGESGQGTIQKMTPAGEISTMVHFSGRGGPAPGAAPRTGLTWGPDGHLYDGKIFRISPAGSYTELVTFSGTSATLGLLEGERPQGSLVERVDWRHSVSLRRGAEQRRQWQQLGQGH